MMNLFSIQVAISGREHYNIPVDSSKSSKIRSKICRDSMINQKVKRDANVRLASLIIRPFWGVAGMMVPMGPLFSTPRSAWGTDFIKSIFLAFSDGSVETVTFRNIQRFVFLPLLFSLTMVVVFSMPKHHRDHHERAEKWRYA